MYQSTFLPPSLVVAGVSSPQRILHYVVTVCKRTGDDATPQHELEYQHAVLHTGTLAAIRYHPVIKAFHDRRAKAGKAAKRGKWPV
jgi:hypothetical protein